MATAPAVGPMVGGGTNIAESARTVSNDQTIFLKLYGGEVYKAYEQAIELTPTIQSHTISNGKSFAFPVHGRTTAGPKAPGQYAVGDDVMRWGEVTIEVDRPDYSEDFVDEIDELHSHYSLREPLVREQGRAHARLVEWKVAAALSVGAQADGPAGITYTVGGTDYALAANRVKTLPTGNSTAAIVQASDFSDVADVMAEVSTLYYDLGMDASQCYLVLDPTTYMSFKRSAEGLKLINRDYNGADNTDYKDGVLPTIYDIKVVRSTTWRDFVDQTVTDSDSAHHRETYGVTNTDVLGLFYHSGAAGKLSLLGLTSSIDDIAANDATLLRTKQCNGVAPLRVESIFTLKLSAS